MRIIEKTYRSQESATPPTDINELVVGLNKNEIDTILIALKHWHERVSECIGTVDETPIEDARVVSDLYYGLKY